jgi:hypothetical protein
MGNIRRVIWVTGVAALLAGCPSSPTTPAPQTGQPESEQDKKPLVVLTGGGGVTLAKQVKHIYLLDLDQQPAERGFLHGQAFKRAIAASLAGWKAWIKEITGAEADAVIREFIKNTQHRAAAELEADACVKEIQGIAKGAEVDSDTFFTYQLYDELLSYLAARKKLIKQPQPGHGTSVGVRGREAQPNLLAQNNDLPPFFASAAVVLRIADKESGGKLLQFTWPGLLGQNGVNDSGLAVAVNALWDSAGQTNGVPMVCIQRALLGKKSVDEALAYLKQVKHGAAMNYMLGDGTKVVTVELAGGEVKVLDSFLKQPFVAHANHPMGKYSGAKRDPANPSPGRTAERLLALANALDDKTATVDVTDLKNLLGSKELKVAPQAGPGATLQSVVFELGARPTMHVASAPELGAGFVDIDFSTQGK